MLNDTAPWCAYQARLTLPSNGRTTLIAAFSDVVQAHHGFPHTDLHEIASAPVDGGENDAARDLVALDAELLLERFTSGKIETFARPLNGGEVFAISSNHWEIDDPLFRFATGCFNIVEWADPNARFTHRIFVDSAQFDSWLATLKPAGFLTARQGQLIGNPQLRAARATASRSAAVVVDVPLGNTPAISVSAPTSVGPQMLKMSEVESMVSLKKSSIHQKIKDGKFPEQIKLGGASRWNRREIEQYIAEQAALRGA